MEIEELLKNNYLLNIKFRLYKRFPSLDELDVESAYNFSVWRAHQKFDENRGCKFVTLFYSILENEFLRLLKEQKKHLHLSLTDKSALNDNFQDYLYDLPLNSSKLLIQRYIEKKTLQEIANELNITAESVRKRIKKLIKKMKES